jgi:tetratricopeptide (TPR) repeat protein
MQSIEELHIDAMNLAEEAFIAQRNGDYKKAEALFSEALDLEQQAAGQLPLSMESEPTRSILYRSAASLAYNSKEYELADRLIARGLSGYPPKDIKEELKNLYEDVNFMRHLRSKGLILDKCQWLMTISGDAVRYGGTAADYLMMRVDRVSSLFYRTVERMLNYPYRTRGGVDSQVKQLYGLFINSFAPSSFAVSFQVGTPDQQLELPGFEKSLSIEPELVVDEIMNCFEIFESNEPQKLKERFDDDNYYGNFVGLAKQIAPDGKNIKLVGFTSIREGKDRPVALRKSRKEIQKDLEEIDSEVPDKSKVSISYSGVLMHANTPLRGKYGTVKLIEKETNKKYDLKVPISIMKDVVQPFYEEYVIIQGYEKEGKLYLEEINLESD